MFTVSDTSAELKGHLLVHQTPDNVIRLMNSADRQERRLDFSLRVEYHQDPRADRPYDKIANGNVTASATRHWPSRSRRL